MTRSEVGTVVRSEGGVYGVELAGGVAVDARLRGRIKRGGRDGDRVVVGDRVEVLVADPDPATVERVLPRRTEVARRGPGGRKPKVLAANVDRVVVVMSLAEPEPNPELLDRFLVIGESNGFTPLIVLNKADLLEAPTADQRKGGAEVGREELRHSLHDTYRAAGYTILETSAVDGRGIDRLRRELDSGISVLAGPSGAGKSALLNALDPELRRRTRPVSRRGGRGRHTTVSAALLPLAGGGRVVDTPGFSDAGPWGVTPHEVSSCFPELRGREEGCRFRRCSHVHEPGCAVLEALEAGELDPRRYRSYRVLLEEAETPR